LSKSPATPLVSPARPQRPKLQSFPKAAPARFRRTPQPRFASLPTDPTSPAIILGFPVACLYVFALFSLATEFSMMVLGVKPYITWIAGPIGILAAIASGNLFLTWRPGPARWLILFALWMALAGAFGIWRGGSFETMQSFVSKQLPAMFMLAALAVTKRQIELLCRIMAFAGVLVLALSLKYGGYEDNRFLIPGTSLENPNDFATHLLIALPFCLLMALNSSRFSPLKMIGVVGVAGLVLTILRSGSRGGLISLVALVGLLFFELPGSKRALLVAVCLLCSTIAVAIFPQILWHRFKTILSSETSEVTTSDADTVGKAEASTEGRLHMLGRSLTLTAQHPILGLGPGNFIVAESDFAKQQGFRAAWLGTHNAYTQASSEGGIPALFLFAAALVSAIRINVGIHRRTRNHPQMRSTANTALCLMLTLFGFSVNILFSHLAYRYYLPLLVGLTVAFSGIAEREIQAVLAQPK
jgi:O-antigen ligase